MDELKAGNLVLIGGIDKYISRTATLVSSSLPLAAVQAVSGMKLKVSPVVAQSVRPKKASDQAAFSKALVQLGKTDSLVSIAFDSQNQQTVIAGAGELHLEVIISDLKQLCGFELVIGDPEVTLRETVIGKCDSSLAKSASKLNRIFLGARPADASLVAACEEGRDIPALVNSHPHWALQERKRIWKAGGEVGPNVLYDATHGSEFLNEAQSTIVSTFAKVAMCGPLVNGDLQGTPFVFCACALLGFVFICLAKGSLSKSRMSSYTQTALIEATFLKPCAELFMVRFCRQSLVC